MAGYGNRTVPSYDSTDLTPENNTTRLGLIDSNTAYHNPHEKHGSGITGGAGYGNKRSSLSSSSSPSSSSSSPPSDLRLASSASSATPTPYSNPTPHGSGSTAGAGYGNKTGDMGGASADSVLGKAMQKVGGVMGSQRVVRMGMDLREKEGFVENEELGREVK